MHRLKNSVASFCLFGLAFTTSAHADSVTKLNMFMANSAQTFSPAALVSYRLMGISVKPLGNSSELFGTFIMPITETVYGKSAYQGLGTAPYAGGSIGSALSIERKLLTSSTTHRITLANFRINYHTRQVLADATIAGESTIGQMPIYTFNVARPMAQELNEIGMLSLDEKLDKLKMTPQGLDLFMRGLKLPAYTKAVLQVMDFGTLTQSVLLFPRLTPVTDAPFIAQ